MATCKVCGKSDVEVEFYTSIATHCKEHWKERVRKNRANNIEYYRQFDRRRANQPKRVRAREAYRRTDAYTQSHAKATARYMTKYPGRRAAQVAIGNAVRDGRVIPWPVCAVPDCCKKPEAHHTDYSKPLMVEWLCSAHHKQAHALTRKL